MAAPTPKNLINEALQLAEETLQSCGFGGNVIIDGKPLAVRISDDSIVDEFPDPIGAAVKVRQITVHVTHRALASAGIDRRKIRNQRLVKYGRTDFKINSVSGPLPECTIRFTARGGRI